MSLMFARVTGKSGCTPGPGSYSLRTTIGNAPQYTLKSRHPFPDRPTTAPYRPLPTSVGEGPKISLASRHKERSAENTPGPGYLPPPLGRDAQKSALASRHAQGRDSRLDNPGPGQYSIAPKFGDANKYTLHGRTGRRTDETISPGPGAYRPNIDAVKPRAPSSTLHIRPSDRASDATPGPSDYQISRDLGGLRSTFHLRTQEAASYATPGPGAYSPGDRALGAAPKYTMKSRHEEVARPITAPYRTLPSSIGEGPKASLASRHRERAAENTPGPGYIPPGLGRDAQKSALASRHAQGRDSRWDNPGPGAYTIAPKFANDANKYTLHGRTGKHTDETASPGPGAYRPNIDAVKPRAPSSSLHIRPEMKGPEQTPGYVNLGSTLNRRGGGITIGLKEYLDVIPV